MFLLLLSTGKAAAEESQFSTQYDVLYEVENTGKASVTQNISITNKNNDVIATSFSIQLDQTNIHSEQAHEDNETLNVTKKVESGSTLIKVFLDNPAIGKGKKKTFSLKYKTDDITNMVGKIWNVQIPRAQISEDTTKYNVEIRIPEEFGPEIYISPTPIIKEQIDQHTHYHFTKNTLEEKGITASFGEYQLVNFKLKYQLENPTYLTSRYEIALPPDIKNYQQVSITSISPKPKSIFLDDDKNIIAQYKIRSKEDLEIEVVGSAKIFAKKITPELGGTFDQIPKRLINLYTKEKLYWETKSSAVISLVTQLKDPNLSVSQNAHKVYDFITQNLKYNTKAQKQTYLERHGAEKTLTIDGEYACMEFTDTFVATVRAMGIPARELNGYAFTNQPNDTPLSINLKSGDLLHAWSQFYDPKFGWIPVDTTWGNTSKGMDYFTKLDTNHFVFVIRGKDSEYPLPAGMYRYNDIDKLVDVDFAENINDKKSIFEPRISIKKVFNFNLFRRILGQQKYKITNSGGVVLYNLNKKYLLPTQSQTLYLKKGTKTINFEDLGGNAIEWGIED